MNRYNWDKAPSWVVDVRKTPIGVEVWTNGVDMVQATGPFWPIKVDCSDWEVVETKKFGERVSALMNDNPNIYSTIILEDPHQENIERLSKLIDAWPTHVMSAEALAKANIVQRIDTSWQGPDLKEIILDGVTEQEWIDSRVLTDADMINLSGRGGKEEFLKNCDDIFRAWGIGCNYKSRDLFSDLYDAGCRFIVGVDSES